MRKVWIPEPRSVTLLEATGPVSPRAVGSPAAASAAFDQALRAAAEQERADADEEGWCVWWASPHFTSGNVVQVSLWLDDNASGSRSASAAQLALERAGFMVRAAPRRSYPDPALCDAGPAHARRHAALMGRLFGVPIAFDVEAGSREVRVEHRWRWREQPCPHCGHVAHPRERIDGRPTPDGALAVALGEAVYGGCLDDDNWPAECARCEEGFRPRR